jgi:hypothetical protein
MRRGAASSPHPARSCELPRKSGTSSHDQRAVATYQSDLPSRTIVDDERATRAGVRRSIVVDREHPVLVDGLGHPENAAATAARDRAAADWVNVHRASAASCERTLGGLLGCREDGGRADRGRGWDVGRPCPSRRRATCLMSAAGDIALRPRRVRRSGCLDLTSTTSQDLTSTTSQGSRRLPVATTCYRVHMKNSESRGKGEGECGATSESHALERDRETPCCDRDRQPKREQKDRRVLRRLGRLSVSCRR